MRCRCCDSINSVTLWKEDWYCVDCKSSISDTIHHDKQVYDLCWSDAIGFVPILKEEKEITLGKNKPNKKSR